MARIPRGMRVRRSKNFTPRDLLPDEARLSGTLTWNRIFEKLKVTGEISKLDNADLELLHKALERQLSRPDVQRLPEHLATLNAVAKEQASRGIV